MNLGYVFLLARIIEVRFEAIAEKEQNIKKKVDTTLSLPSEEASPVVIGPLDASKIPFYLCEVRDKFAEFFKDKGSVKKVLSATKLSKGGNSHSAYFSYHLEDKVNFEGVGNVTPWAAEVERRKRVKCYRKKEKSEVLCPRILIKLKFDSIPYRVWLTDSRNSESKLHSSLCLVGERNEMEIPQNPVYVEFNIP
ncbi:hypothetical protein Tco_1341881 [Tanacetum coccineum]